MRGTTRIAAAMNLCFQLLQLTVSGWINRYQQRVIVYLQAKNHALPTTDRNAKAAASS